jgi:hypothetical protein
VKPPSAQGTNGWPWAAIASRKPARRAWLAGTSSGPEIVTIRFLPRATSLNGTDWTSAHTTTTGDGGFDEIALDTSARYVRLNLTQRGTAYGYSLWEFGVYG